MAKYKYKVVKEKLDSKKYKKWTFRKWLLLIVLVMMLVTTIATYVMSAIGVETVEAIPLAFIGMLSVAFTVYVAGDCKDHESANKYKINLEDIDEADGDESTDNK